VVCAIPTQFIRATFSRLGPAIEQGVPVVSVAKGIESSTFRLPAEILREAVRADLPVVALSGPTIAAELAQRLPALLVAASPEQVLAERVQAAFTSPWTKVYQSGDLVGVELAGACKNVIAIAAGVCDGLRLGTNAKSALLARGLAEISRVGVALGGKVETFFGVAGAGDLATTCFAPEGRNRSFGERLGRGESVERALGATLSVVEGVPTSRALMELARSRAIDLPICEAVEAMVFDALAPREALAQLMSRPSTVERIG
jgi:glycerol-3-phosphate dehydrogenase (NAD(P)+)